MGGVHVCGPEEVARFSSIGGGLDASTQSPLRAPIAYPGLRTPWKDGLSTYFSTFDLARGFYQVPLETSDMDKMVLNSS